MPRLLDRFRHWLTPASQGRLATRRSLLTLARQSGDPFKSAPYFDQAESDMDAQWKSLIWPWIHDLDFDRVLDLAAGHGRNSAKLREVASEIVITDINDECLAACRRRFAGDARFRFVKTDGSTLEGVADATITLVYSFDSMVHFAPEVVRSYLLECQRVLEPGGHGFCHHSNYVENPRGDFRSSPHWRNYMSRELFASYCQAAGLEVLRSEILDWGSGPDRHVGLDCLTLFRRPWPQPSV